LGKQNISTGGSAFSPAYTTYSALLAYDTAFNLAGEHLQVKFQLNVDNLTDNKNLVYTGYTQFGTSTQGAGYYFVAPRKYALSANIKF
jgi:outer membrane receptor for monomeric catechols